MKTTINPYDAFNPALNHLLAYIIGKAAMGDSSASKALADWELEKPPKQIAVNVTVVADE